MAIDVSVQDPGSAQAGTGDDLPIFIGASTAGTINTVTTHGSIKSLKTLGDGPTVQQAGGGLRRVKAVACVKVTGSVAGTSTAVTPTLAGSATGTITLAGEATDDYEARVVCTLTGTLGAGEFKFSLDGGNTYSPSLVIPAGGTYLIPHTGVTLTFVPGAGTPFFEKDDLHTFETTGPFFGITEIAAAFTAIRELGLNPTRGIHLCGRPADATTAMSLAVALDAQMATYEQTGVWDKCVIDAGRDTASAIRTAIIATAAPRVAPAVHRIRMAAAVPFMGYGLPYVPLAYAATERMSANEPSEALYRYASGAITGAAEVEYNEEANGLFKNVGAITGRSRTGQPGIYFATGGMMAPAGSDLNETQYRDVMNLICRTAYQASQPFEGDSFRVIPDGTGFIDERDASRIEAFVQSAVDSAVSDPLNASGFKGHVSAVLVQVDRAFDILTAKEIQYNVTAVKLAYGRDVTATVGFAASVGGAS